MNVQLQTLPETSIAILRHRGPYGAAIGRFWRLSFDPWASKNDLMAYTRYGISHDDPSITPPAQCRYDAGVELPPGFVVAAPAVRITLPGGRYAVMPFEGDVDSIGAAWRWLSAEWLPGSGFCGDDRPCFERYDPAHRPRRPEDFACDICIPVGPL